MNFNVSAINTYSNKINAIDAIDAQKITSEIFSKTKEENVDLNNLNLSKFNRTTLGLNLYGNKINAIQANQIALRHTDADIKLSENFIANVQYLNSQAAQSVFTTKQVNGKIAAPVNEDTKETGREVIQLPVSTEVEDTTNLNKDKKGSNPFSFYVKSESNNNEGERDSISIFA